MEARNFILENGRLVLPDSVLEGGSLVVEDEIITSIIEAGKALPASLPRINLRGAWLSPGLVELHIHGCGGVGFDELGSGPEEGAAALRRARDFLRARGITCFVPTLVCREAELASLAAAIDQAGIAPTTLPGIYVEGPFINAARRGGIPADTILAADPLRLARILDLARGKIKLMTVAPELAGAEEIMARIAEAAILPCLGHSDANLEEAPLPLGPFSITHLFNAMSPFSHKEAGLAMLPFLDRRPYFELNADGVHVGESALRAAAAALDPDRLILISDATVAAGLPHGDYSYYGMKIVSGPDGARYADSGILMGSNSLAPDVLRNWLHVTGATVPAAVKALTLTPSKALGLDDRRGAIKVGLKTDLVVWEGEFDAVRAVYGDKSLEG